MDGRRDTAPTSQMAKREAGQMNQKTFMVTIGVVCSLIAVLHGLRILLGWEAVIGGWSVPVWISWVAVAVFAYFAYTAFTARS